MTAPGTRRANFRLGAKAAMAERFKRQISSTRVRDFLEVHQGSCGEGESNEAQDSSNYLCSRSYGPKMGSVGKPSPSKSSATRGNWFLRDRGGGQIARVSKRGVRLAGSNEFAQSKQAAGRKRIATGTF